MNNFNDRHVLITGAAHGIGTGFARRFLQEGARLILVDIDGPALGRVFDGLGAAPGRHLSYIADIGDHQARERLFQDLKDKGVEVDVLVNNIGIGYRSDLVDSPWEKLQKVIDVDVVGTTHLTWLFLPGMKKRGRGAVINLSSTGAFCGANQACVYTGAKAFIMNFSEGLDMELYDSGVRILCAFPGATDTNFWQASGWENSQYNKRIKMMSAEETANEFVDALRAGRKQHIAGLRNRLMVIVAGFIPREMLKRMAVQKYK